MNKYQFSCFLTEAEGLKINQPRLSERKIVKRLSGKYKVNPNTLRVRWRRHTKIKEQKSKIRPQIRERLKNMRSKGKPILSVEEETSLVTLLKVLAKTNHSLKKSDIIEYIRKKYMKDNKSWRGDKYVKKFLKRNKKVLQLGNLKLISKARVDPDSIQSCDEFISVMDETVENINMTPETTYNVDEFQLKVSGYSAGRGRITFVKENGLAHKQVSCSKRGGCIGSLISFIAANGQLVFSALCLKPDAKCRTSEMAYIDIDSVELRAHNTRNRPIPQLRIYTETGMIDNDCWRQIWSAFLSHIESVDISLDLTKVVYMDNLKSHTQLTCIEEGLSKNVEVRLLPKGTSQFSQPCDSFVFGTLRKQINKKVSSKITEEKDDTLNHMIRDLIPEFLEKAFTPHIIQSSFKETGLFPFNGDILRQHCQENLGLQDTPNPLAPLEECVAGQVVDIFNKPKKQPKTKRKRALVSLKQAYTTGHIIEAAKEEKKTKAEQETEKKEKKHLMELKKAEEERVKKEKKQLMELKKREMAKKKRKA